MRIFKKILVFGFLTISGHIFGQAINPKFAGNYSDELGSVVITELSLYENGTFKLKTPDPIFSYTHQSYENIGNWISKQDTIFLNPDTKAQNKTIKLTEKQIGRKDSITIKINYLVDYFEGDSLIEQKKFDFDLLTICINKKKKYYNLVRQPQMRGCLFAPSTKNQIFVDSTNTIRLSGKEISQIGVFTYGFENIEWLKISNKETDFIEITIIQPVDKNRIPKNRAVVIKGNKAYFYTRNGKIDKSLTPLTKHE